MKPGPADLSYIDLIDKRARKWCPILLKRLVGEAKFPPITEILKAYCFLMTCVNGFGQNTLDRCEAEAMFYNGDNFCAFLFEFLHTNLIARGAKSNF